MERWERRGLLIGAVIVAAVTVSVALVAPHLTVRQQFVFHDAAIYDLSRSCAPAIDAARDTVVSFHWSTPAPTIFFVVGCGGSTGVPYEGNGSSGSGAFVSAGGWYKFGASCPEGPCIAANVSGSFTGPLLPF
ncbi:MAG TPA: hypothetical protein VMH49_07285 [Thermoplasmata archaeon]|nr:hypothetical protein [Thermoplasmata archaeon]